MLLNNQQVTEEVKEEILKRPKKKSGKENTMTQNLWGAAKAALQGSLGQYNSTPRNKNIKQTTSPHTESNGKRAEEPKAARRKQIIRIRAGRNEKEMGEAIAKISKTKSWFSEKMNKIDKSLSRITKEKGED